MAQTSEIIQDGSSNKVQDVCGWLQGSGDVFFLPLIDAMRLCETLQDSGRTHQRSH